MAQNKIQVVQFRRKRDGKTDYKKRKRLLFTITVTPVFNVAKGTDVDYSVIGSQGTDK